MSTSLSALPTVAFGRAFVANPDLVERLEAGAALAEADPATLHGGGEQGYTDYPALDEARRDAGD